MSAGDFITVNPSTITAANAQDLLNFVYTIREVMAQADKVKGLMDHMTATQITARFGLADDATSTTVQTMVGNCRSAIRAASTLEIIDRVG